MYEYRAEILSVYDGDGSFDAIIDLGMNITLRKKIRLFGIDTPEMRGNQKKAGKVVRDFVRSLILHKDVTIKTQRDATGKYGRLLAYIFIDEIELGSYLVSEGLAKVYLGDKKETWTKKELEFIANAGGIK